MLKSITNRILLCLLIFLAGVKYCSSQQIAQQKPPKQPLLSPIALAKHIHKPKYKVGASLYYSRSRNNWGGNYWNGNIISLSIYDNKKWTPNVVLWYDPITTAKGISLGTKVIDLIKIQ